MKKIQYLSIPQMLRRLGIVFFLFLQVQAYGAVKTSNGSGSWSTTTNWSPTGVPVAGDVVTIRSGDSLNINNNYSLASLTISSGGIVSMTSSKTLTMTGALIVNGKMTMNGGNITFSTSGAAFEIGAAAFFTWEPGTNTVGAATLFTNGVESFATTSTLIIKKWYNYSIALGTVITGNFGNLTMNSMNGAFLTEWNQNNQFQTHQIIGTLTIDQGWIVLDKSGNISNTTIGNISLLNVNSYLDLHGNNHAGSFTVNTTNITVVAGMLNGIYDGNGNVTLNVSGNVSISSSGYIFLIYNDGVAGKGNGNCTMTVSGNFTQTSGNFRGIYNLTTFAAGTSTLSFANLTLTGGTFMGHYGCHVGGELNTFNVTGNVSINFANATDIFRMVGLSSLSSTINNIRLSSTIGGTFTTAGNGSAEVFSNVSSGVETVSITGNTTFGGCTNSFDYGIAAAAHAFTTTFSGNVSVTGGTVYLSRIGGNGTTSVTGNVDITGGTLIAKGDVGTQTFTVGGNFTQSNGTFYLHKNTTTNTTNIINTIVNGTFTHSGGTINFDDNTSSSAATHTLTINGSSYNLTGAGTMTHASAGTGTVFGQINFNRAGTITYTRSSTSHAIQQVKQTINNGCTLDVSGGKIQVSSHATAATTYFTVVSGGILNMNTNQIGSNGTSTNSGLRIESGGLMKIAKTTGLYDGTSSGTIISTGNMDFYLGSTSTIEYNGTDNQVLTGTGIGIATTSNHKYGNLRINFGGTADAEYVYPTASNVYVRTNLNLEAGELNLNNYMITIEAGGSTAVTRNTGYLKSETNAAVNNSILKWMALTSGNHIFPFGANSTEYIPITFSPSAGMGGYASIATRATATANNAPWAGISNVAAVSNMSKDGIDVTAEYVIDRWYNLDAPGFIADVTLSYRGSENTTLSANATGSFSIQSWNGTEWSAPFGSSVGVTSGIGTLFVPNATSFSPWIGVSSSGTLPIELISFDAIPNGEIVDIQWITASEKNNNFFTLDRSGDGKNFITLEQIDGAENSSNTLTYNSRDLHPLPGTSYYRLKQTDFDGKFTYSKLAVVKFSSAADAETKQLDIVSVSPNPFKDQFSVNYYIAVDEMITIQLISSTGQMAFTQQVQGYSGNNRFDYSEGYKLNKGTYVLIVTGNGAKLSRKIIKNM